MNRRPPHQSTVRATPTRTELPNAPGPSQPAMVGHQHRDVSGGWLRPSVFGLVDGLVSNFAIIAGVAAASPDVAKPVILAGAVGLVGGAFSMGSGEYISVRSQNELMQSEVAIERDELEHNFDAEVAELAEIYRDRGVDADLAQLVAEQLSADPDQALQIHAQEELGVDIHDLPSPYVAAVASFISFSVGAFVPLLPFLFSPHVLPVAAVLALLALFGSGAVTARFTGRSWWYSGGRQLLFGLASAAFGFGVGHLVGATVS